MENNRTTKVLLMLVLLVVAVQFAITLFSRGEANSAIDEMKAARAGIEQAMKSLSDARVAINGLATQLEEARNGLNTINSQVERLDRDMVARMAQVNNRLNVALADIRKENQSIVDLQKKLSTLQDYENQ